MMLAIGVLYILRYIPSIPNFIEHLSWKDVEFYERFFSTSIEIMHRFLPLLLLICCITFNDLHILKHPCIPAMKPTWSWCMIFLICYWVGFAIIFF
jgi:hypothetical protein